MQMNGYQTSLCPQLSLFSLPSLSSAPEFIPQHVSLYHHSLLPFFCDQGSLTHKHIHTIDTLTQWGPSHSILYCVFAKHLCLLWDFLKHLACIDSQNGSAHFYEHGLLHIYTYTHIDFYTIHTLISLNIDFFTFLCMTFQRLSLLSARAI